MAEKPGFSSDHFSSPIFSKGRGVWRAGPSFTDRNVVVGGLDCRGEGLSQLLADNGRDTGLGQNPGCTPVGQFMGEGPHTSTPGFADGQALHQLSDMMGQLGTQIGESIVAKLMSAGVVNMTPQLHDTSSPIHMVDDSNAVRQEASHVTVHVKSDREPQIFRGDGTDRYSVQDWIDLTKAYLRKQKCPVHEQAEEIMGRLVGKARDIVRVSLRSDQTLTVGQNQ